MNSKTICLSALGIFMLSFSAVAHHTAENLNFDQTIELSGTVKEFQWTNPYTVLLLEVTGDDGTAKEWLLDLNSPGSLSRHGWNEATLEPGDQVTVTIYPLKQDMPGGRALSVELPDGTVTAQ
jgi:hypothetical protein